MRRRSRHTANPAPVSLLAVLGLLVAVGGCISGRVLTGYPGYPFARFDTGLASDSAFFLLQPAVESEGFPLDYTVLAEGLITTRSTEMAGRPVFLNLVLEPLDAADECAIVGPDRDSCLGSGVRGDRIRCRADQSPAEGSVGKRDGHDGPVECCGGRYYTDRSGRGTGRTARWVSRWRPGVLTEPAVRRSGFG